MSKLYLSTKDYVYIKGKTYEQSYIKLDWVGPIDNRPSTNKLHRYGLGFF